MFYKRLLFLMAWTLLWFLPSHAQSVEIRTLVTLYNGEEQLFVLSEDDQITFDGQEALQLTIQESTHRIPIDDIRKIEFVDITDTQEIQAGVPFFYPNPVTKSIVIGNIETQQTVSVYSLEGRLIYQRQANPNEAIDLSNLPAGLYILNLCEKNFKLLKL